MEEWDDGYHEKVKKVRITHSYGAIYSMQVYYRDNGNTVPGVLHGDPIGNELVEIELHEDEYLTGMTFHEGSWFSSHFTFKTNQRTFGPYGMKYPVPSLREIVAGEGRQITGFRGISQKFLRRLFAGYGPIRSSGPTKLSAQGDKSGKIWDDGAKHDGVSNVMVGVGDKGIHCIKFDYDKSGILDDGPTHGLADETFSLPPFKLDRPEEFLASVVGYHDAGIVQGLQFLTNKRESRVFGYEEGTKFTLEVLGMKIIGFHGYADKVLSSLGAYFVPIPFSSSTRRSEAYGGEGPGPWEDGADHDGVRKIVAGVGQKGVHYVKFDYDKSGKLVDGPRHGLTDGTLPSPSTFDIDHPHEHLVSVVGYYEGDNIQGLRFKTNKREFEVGYCDVDTTFTLEEENMKIVGFHGYAYTALHSLGAYFLAIPPPLLSFTNKVGVQGGVGGKQWDDVADHDGVRKIVVGVGRKGVHYVKFDYDKSGQLIDGPIHGLTSGTISPPTTFEINHPDEYLVSLVGRYDGNAIQGLQFKTNKRESQVLGYGKGTKFTLEVKDKKIVGFHGYSDMYLNSLGAYFAPISFSPPHSIVKSEARGGKGETIFDDGTFDGVRKVCVGQGDSCVSYVKFEYEKDGKVESRDHGKRGILGDEELELEVGEYITSIEGFYEKIYPFEEAVVSALIFQTSEGRTSMQFGISSGERFQLDGEGGKLVGFHGSVGEVLHSLGAYFAPSTTPLDPPNK